MIHKAIWVLLVSSLCLFVPSPASPSPNCCIDGNSIVTAFAGTGTAGYDGDGGPALSAEFQFPCGLAMDPAGNLYVADSGNNVVRMVSSGGTVSTVAGDGSAGYSGDGGPALSAQLDNPRYIALDGSGNLYICDSDNNRIRRVDIAGTISTVAGNGTTVYMGDGGPATLAALNYPYGIAADATGNLYISEFSGSRIRRVDSAGFISTVAGTGVPGDSGDGGPANLAQINVPENAVLDPWGNLYFFDDLNYRVRMIDTSGIITTVLSVLGTGDPEGMAFCEDNIYMTVWNRNDVWAIDCTGALRVLADSSSGNPGDGGPLASANFLQPMGLVYDPDGNLLVADTGANRIRRIAPSAACTLVCSPTIGPSATPTDTGMPSPTPTDTRTETPTVTDTWTPTETDTPADTPTPTESSTDTPCPTDTHSMTPTASLTATPTDTATDTPTETPSFTATETPTISTTDTSTITPTETVTSTPNSSLLTPAFTASPVPLAGFFVWPNPFDPETAQGGTLKAGAIPAGSTFNIYSVSGELVRAVAERDERAEWDARNARGLDCSPGIYYYTVVMEGAVRHKGVFILTRGQGL